MRSLTILRKKHFAGCFIQYFCVLNVMKSDFLRYIENNTADNEGNQAEYRNEYSDLFYPIVNGKEISICIDNSEYTLFVVAFTSTGIAFSNEITIEAGNISASYILQTKYNFFKGSSYLLTEKSSE